MRILGIETSCDETAISIIDVNHLTGLGHTARVRILSNVIASQAKLHAKFGGVVPYLAKREHQKNLVPVLLAALRGVWMARSIRSVYTYDRKYKRRERDNDVLGRILEREPELLVEVRERLLPMRPPEIDAIAVTVGPGLAPALWVGANFAKALAYLWGKPLIPVNHLEGHIITNLLPQIRVNPKSQIPNSKQIPNPKSQIQNGFEFRILSFDFPAMALLVSGGHTELVLMTGCGKYRVIGETLDDAAGEAFDKVARLLGLGFPGGPAIARLAEQWKSQIPNPKFQTNPKSQILNSKQMDKLGIKLPRPMLNSKDFNFSFSGLKTAVLYLLRDLKKSHSIRALQPLVAREFQQVVVDVLVAKTIRAARQYRVKTVMIGGGVAANKKLRKELGEALKNALPGTRYLVPDTRLTGDNALMIALAAWFNRNKKTSWKNIEAHANLRLDALQK